MNGGHLDEDRFTEFLAQFYRLSLVETFEHGPAGVPLTLHPVVRAWLLARMTKDEASAAAKDSILTVVAYLRRGPNNSSGLEELSAEEFIALQEYLESCLELDKHLPGGGKLRKGRMVVAGIHVADALRRNGDVDHSGPIFRAVIENPHLSQWQSFCAAAKITDPHTAFKIPAHEFLGKVEEAKGDTQDATIHFETAVVMLFDGSSGRDEFHFDHVDCCCALASLSRLQKRPDKMKTLWHVLLDSCNNTSLWVLSNAVEKIVERFVVFGPDKLDDRLRDCEKQCAILFQSYTQRVSPIPPPLPICCALCQWAFRHMLLGNYRTARDLSLLAEAGFARVYGPTGVYPYFFTLNSSLVLLFSLLGDTDASERLGKRPARGFSSKTIDFPTPIRRLANELPLPREL